MTTRLRLPLAAAVLAGLAIAGPSAAQAAPASAVTLAAPADHAQPAGALPLTLQSTGTVKDLSARLDDRAVALRRSGDGELRARLTAARFDAGQHHLVLSWRDSAGRRRTKAIELTALRRAPSLLTVNAPRRTTSGLVSLQVTTPRDAHAVRVSVNGHTVTYSPRNRAGRTVTLQLGATNGIGFGKNTIRVVATRPASRTYDSASTIVTVDRDRPLLGRTAPYRALAGTSTRLDGRVRLAGAGAALAGQTRYRWTIVSQPKGSKPTLRDAGTARPTISSSTLGRYRLRLSVVAPPKPGAHAADADPTVQTVTYDVTPPVPVSGAWLETEPGADTPILQFGDATIPLDTTNQASGHACPTLLLVDASTLAPLNVQAGAGGAAALSALPACDDDAGLNGSLKTAVAAASAIAGDDPILAVLATPPHGGGAGVKEIVTADASTYVFTPNPAAADFGVKSGWYHEAASGSTSGTGVRGWLQRQLHVVESQIPGQPGTITGYGPYEFSPGALLTFQTHDPKSGGEGFNRMWIGKQGPGLIGNAPVGPDGTSMTPIDGTLPSGAVNGFQLAVLNAEGKLALASTFTEDEGDKLAGALNELQTPGSPNGTILLQSVGRPTPHPAASSWDALATAVSKLDNGRGAADALLRLGSTPAPAATAADQHPGTWAMVAAFGDGAQPDPQGNAPTTATADAIGGGRGELSGLLQMSPHGALAPVSSGALSGSTGQLKALTMGVPTPVADDPASYPVLRFLTKYNQDNWQATGANSCYTGVTNLPDRLLVRASYCSTGTSQSDWSTWAGDLSRWAEPTSSLPAGYVNPADPDGATFRRVAATLNTEFVAVGSVRGALSETGTLHNLLGDVNADLPSQGLHGLGIYTPTAAQPTPPQSSFNLWRLVTPTLTLFAEVPGFNEITPLVDLMELGEVFLDGDHSDSVQPEGMNKTVAPVDLVHQAQERVTDAQLGLSAVLDRILTDPAKLLRINANLHGFDQTAPFKNPGPGNLYAANWNPSDVQLDGLGVQIVQGLNQGLAQSWMSAYYQVWQVPTADARKKTGSQLRAPSDIGQLTCHYQLGSVDPEIVPFSVFADANQPAATYVPLDQSAPTALSTLVQHQNGDSPWQSPVAGTSGKPNPNRHVTAPNPKLLALLTQSIVTGGYGLTTSELFTRGIQTINPISAKDQNNFYNGAANCGW